MDSFKIQVFLHVAAVVVALGATFAFPFLEGAAKRSGVGACRFVLQFEDRLLKILVIPGAILVFVFGLGLIFDDTTHYKDDFPVWLGVAIAWFVAAFVLAVMVQRSSIKAGLRALDGVADDAPLPEAYRAVATRMQIVGGVLGLSVIAITFLMIWKPGE